MVCFPKASLASCGHIMFHCYQFLEFPQTIVPTNICKQTYKVFWLISPTNHHNTVVKQSVTSLHKKYTSARVWENDWKMKMISVSLSYSVADITYFTFTKCFAFMYEQKLFLDCIK